MLSLLSRPTNKRKFKRIRLSISLPLCCDNYPGIRTFARRQGTNYNGLRTGQYCTVVAPNHYGWTAIPEVLPLPDARGEERSDGRVRTMLLLVSTSLALGLGLGLGFDAVASQTYPVGVVAADPENDGSLELHAGLDVLLRSASREHSLER